MSDIVKSLKHFQLEKEVRMLLKNINPLITTNNLKSITSHLYLNNIIDRNDFLVINTKLLTNRFCNYIEATYPNLKCGIYLYDEHQKTIWNCAAPHVPEEYNEYSQGLFVGGDIAAGETDPIYVNKIIVVGDVVNSDDLISMNHRKELLKNGLLSFSTAPLKYKNKIIGYQVLYSFEKWEPQAKEVQAFFAYTKFLEENLLYIKQQLIELSIENSI
jgi:hypothetical protein